MTEETKKVEKPKEVKITPEQEKKNVETYNKFAELHILMCDENGFDKKKLKPSAYENYTKLKKEVEKFKGKKPKKTSTVFVGIGQPLVRIVEGYPVPDSILKIFTDARIAGKWF